MKGGGCAGPAFRDFGRKNFCANCLLTKLLGCGIIEISARLGVGGPAILTQLDGFVNSQNKQKKSPHVWGDFHLKLVNNTNFGLDRCYHLFARELANLTRFKIHSIAKLPTS